MANRTVRTAVGPSDRGPAGPRRAVPWRRSWWAALVLAALLPSGPASASERTAPVVTPASAAPSGGQAAATAREGRAASTRQAESAVVLDFSRGTGAALVRRGESALVVFDSPELRNPEALQRWAAAASAEVRTLSQGLVLVVPQPAAPAIGLARGSSGGWVLGPSRTPAGSGRAVSTEGALATGGGPAPAVAFEGVPPNRVVVTRDPESGLPLLVGTTREAGRGFAGGRRAPEYDLLETELGVAVLARSESLQLRASPDRFLLSGSALSPLSLDSAAIGPTAGATMTRCLGLPDLRPEQLLTRLRSQSAQLAATEPLGRAALRRELAATMLALGMAHEAQAEMKRAAVEDGSAGAARDERALAAAAALVAGRVEEASAAFRADAATPDCDESVLWHSLFLAGAGEPQAALSGLRATLPLLLSYPAGLRDRLLPSVAEAFAQAGAWQPLRGLLADPPLAARLPLAAAMLAEADGNAEGALAGYDALAAGRDRRARAVALRRAVELRLDTGRMDHAAAARAYAASLTAWRGDAAERDARFRLAQLLALSDDPVAALALLRQTAALFPDHAVAARREAGRVLRAAFDAGSPLGAVAAFQAESDLLPSEDRETLEARLVDSLLALDLPARASALLHEAAGRATGQVRAEIGLRLAALRLREGDMAGARSALDATDAREMVEELRARRNAVAAELAERGGGPARPGSEGAVAAAKAGAALSRRDWAGAAQALREQLEARLPSAPAALDREQQEAVVRLAAALTLAGDAAGVAALRERFADRMGEGPHAEAFGRLAAEKRLVEAGVAESAAGSPAAH